MRFSALFAIGVLLLGGMAQADTKLVGGDMYFHGTIRALACSTALEATKSRSISGKSQRRISIFRGAVSRKNSAFSYATATPRFFAGSRSLSVVVRMLNWTIIWRWIAVNRAARQGSVLG